MKGAEQVLPKVSSHCYLCIDFASSNFMLKIDKDCHDCV